MSTIAAPCRIVLAEDDDNDLRLAQRAITKSMQAVDLVVARDGREALDLLLHESAGSPDLIVTDLKMPLMNGRELIGALRNDRRYISTPIIVFTSTSEPAEVAACVKAGCTAFVQKPTEFSEYMDVVSGFIRAFANKGAPSMRMREDRRTNPVSFALN